MSELVNGAEVIEAAIQDAQGPAICAYVTAGYPTLDAFPKVLKATCQSADVVEIGVPFTDPMADGLTIQQASHVALENGVTLQWILDAVAAVISRETAPCLLMGYYNPFLAFGLEKLGSSLANAGVSGLIVPDLPHDEAGELLDAITPHGIALVQLVTPTTSLSRLETLVSVSGGFVYAVTTTGVTGGDVEFPETTLDYLDRVREVSPIPVLAGFGIRTSAQVAALEAHVDGVVVGSALIEAIDAGVDPAEFIASLRMTEVPS
ncbi:MAG: tryptophan synthase subunit alpha [Acidimicrobiia bacterium]